MSGGPGWTAPPRKCADCPLIYVGKTAWEMGDRRGADTYHGGWGRCIACYSRRKRQQERADRRPRPPRSGPVFIIKAEDLLEDYEQIRDSVSSIAEAAQRMGIKVDRLDRALYRARKRGDERGRAPLEQRARAVDFGRPFGTEAKKRAS